MGQIEQTQKDKLFNGVSHKLRGKSNLTLLTMLRNSSKIKLLRNLMKG